MHVTVCMHVTVDWYNAGIILLSILPVLYMLQLELDLGCLATNHSIFVSVRGAEPNFRPLKQYNVPTLSHALAHPWLFSHQNSLNRLLQAEMSQFLYRFVEASLHFCWWFRYMVTLYACNGRTSMNPGTGMVAIEAQHEIGFGNHAAWYIQTSI